MQINYPKGRVVAHGYFFKRDAIPHSQLVERMISSWKSNSKAFTHSEGILLLWDESESIRLDESLAIPIMRKKNLYSNTLLSDAQQGDLLRHEPSLHLILEGAEHICNLSELEKFDPAIWFDVSGYPLDSLTTLGYIPPAKNSGIAAPQKIRELISSTNLRESDAQVQAMQALADPDAFKGENSKRKSLMAMAISAFKEVVTKNADGREGMGQYQTGQEINRSLFSKLRDALQNQVMASKLGQLIGQRQAQYLQEMMEKFNNGDLNDALRHAIPLSNLQDAIKSKRAAMGLPGMRNQLSISPHSSPGASGSLHIDDLVMQHMRKLYQKAFARLDAEKRFEEAAFVLAELLRDIDRAVKYLEDHGQLRLAAQLAEGQRLSPARIVRQWIIAGDIPRAMQIATIACCYQEAISLLERHHKPQADQLRWNCAQLHFKAGDYATAIQIAWPLEHHRPEILSWLHLSIAENSTMSGINWVKLILLDSEKWQEHLATFARLLTEGSPYLESSHFLMIEEVLKSPDSQVSKILADLFTRSYLRLVSARKLSFQTRVWQRLIDRTGDKVLRADCRNLQFNDVPENPLTAGVNEFHFDAAQGRRPYDAAQLSNGNFIVALGEAGVEIYNPRAKLIAHFSEPCHKIILSDLGNHALLVAMRTGYQTISRYKLATNKVVACFDVSLSCWANSFDGINWFVAKDNSVWLLDMQTTSPTVIWSVEEPNRTVAAFERTAITISIIFSDDSGYELWRYGLPNLFLRERNPIQKMTLATFNPVAFNSEGIVAGICPADSSQFGIFPRVPPVDWHQLEHHDNIAALTFANSELLVFAKQNDGLHAERYLVEQGKVIKRLGKFSFLTSESVIARAIDNRLIIATNEGRIISFNLTKDLIDADFVI